MDSLQQREEGRGRNGMGMRNDGRNEGREREGCWKWGLQRDGGVHFHAQSVKVPPMMTIMSVNTEEGRRRLYDEGNGWSIIMGNDGN